MKISTNRVATAAGTKAKQRPNTSDTPFSLDPVSSVQDTAAPVEAGGVQAVSALLALQEVRAPASQARQKALQHAAHLVQVLEHIRLALLKGELETQLVAQLQDLVTRRDSVRSGLEDIEPELGDLLREIDIRAAVELEKLRLSKKAPMV